MTKYQRAIRLVFVGKRLAVKQHIWMNDHQ